jgi:hypothetical protein
MKYHSLTSNEEVSPELKAFLLQANQNFTFFKLKSPFTGSKKNI